MDDAQYYANEVSLMNLRIQDLEEQRDNILDALIAFQKVDDFAGWHPNYSDAIEKARAAIAKATGNGSSQRLGGDGLAP